MVLPFERAPIERMSAAFAIALIRLYQRRFPSRWKRACLLEPHCSAFAIIALRKYGFVDGAARSIRRLRRCRPGVDRWLDDP